MKNTNPFYVLKENARTDFLLKHRKIGKLFKYFTNDFPKTKYAFPATALTVGTAGFFIPGSTVIAALGVMPVDVRVSVIKKLKHCKSKKEALEVLKPVFDYAKKKIKNGSNKVKDILN